MAVDRQTVDLSAYPDLVVIYLGMPVRRPRGMLRLLGLGPQIQKSWKEQPDGLLLHEDITWSLIPPHFGMRQYWRDLDSLERWTRSEPHKLWGSNSSKTLVEPAFGTKPTSRAAAWRRSTTTSSHRLALPALRRRGQPVARCSRRGGG
jgi:Domain of unknown function (DUF4188)